MTRSFFKGIGLCSMLLAAQAAAAQPLAVNRNPVRSAAGSFEAMFDLPASDSAYFFRVDLPDDNFITMRFNRLSYWQPGKLQEVIDIAKLAREELRDSLNGVSSAQRIALSVPAANIPVAAAVREHGSGQRVLMLGNSGATPIRIAHDTISVRRSFRASATDTSSHPAILYTFLLKDLGAIDALAADAPLINAVSATFDSLVADRRKQWKKQDAPVHSLTAELDFRRNTSAPALQVSNDHRLLRRFDFFAEFGLSVLSTNTAFAANAKIAYNWQVGNAPAGLFAAVSFSGLGFVKRVDERFEKQYIDFVNLEYGFTFAQGRNGFPIYRTSVGFGYQIDAHNVAPYDFQYRAFLSYSISRAVTLVADCYFLRKNEATKQERLGIGGMTVLVRLL